MNQLSVRSISWWRISQIDYSSDRLLEIGYRLPVIFPWWAESCFIAGCQYSSRASMPNDHLDSYSFKSRWSLSTLVLDIDARMFLFQVMCWCGMELVLRFEIRVFASSSSGAGHRHGSLPTEEIPAFIRGSIARSVGIIYVLGLFISAMPHPSISGRAKEWKEQIHDTASDETLDDNESSSWEINTKEGRQQRKRWFRQCSLNAVKRQPVRH
jgi:hypothetical protein